MSTVEPELYVRGDPGRQKDGKDREKRKKPIGGDQDSVISKTQCEISTDTDADGIQHKEVSAPQAAETSRDDLWPGSGDARLEHGAGDERPKRGSDGHRNRNPKRDGVRRRPHGFVARGPQ
jgi:hypothetical protein